MAVPYLGKVVTKIKVYPERGRRYRQPMAGLLDRHASKMVAGLSCFDRVVIHRGARTTFGGKRAAHLKSPTFRQRNLPPFLRLSRSARRNRTRRHARAGPADLGHPWSHRTAQQPDQNFDRAPAARQTLITVTRHLRSRLISVTAMLWRLSPLLRAPPRMAAPNPIVSMILLRFDVVFPVTGVARNIL